MTSGNRFGAVLIAILSLTLHACGASPAAERELTAPLVQVSLRPASPTADAIPPTRVETDLDRTIRVQLDKSFADEPSLRDRDISFSVDGSDITLTGTVRTEAERRKAREVTMNVPGVRSVANALRVSL